MTFARSLFVIHNVAHQVQKATRTTARMPDCLTSLNGCGKSPLCCQGRGPFQELEHFEIPHDMRDAFFLDDPIGGEHMNIMKVNYHLCICGWIAA